MKNMNLTVEIPDDVARRLNASGGDLSRRALEALVAEEYRQSHLTKPDIRRLLGLETSDQIDSFLRAHESLDRLHARGSGSRTRGLEPPRFVMLLVVADTSPLRYLVQIEQINLLPRLFEKIFLPSVVAENCAIRQRHLLSNSG